MGLFLNLFNLVDYVNYTRIFESLNKGLYDTHSNEKHSHIIIRCVCDLVCCKLQSLKCDGKSLQTSAFTDIEVVLRKIVTGTTLHCS